MLVFMKVTQDEYELPIAIGDTARELADQLGITRNAVHAALSRAKKAGRVCAYRRVEIEEEDEE